MSDADYEAWVASMEQAPAHLDDAAFKQFATPTINYDNATTRFSAVQASLFDHVMQDVMTGNVYPTPPNMTEKKAHKIGDGKQQTISTASSPDQEQR